MIEAANLVGRAAGAVVANFEHFDLLDPRRRANIDDVALVRLHQRSGDRRYPAHLTATEIGLVDPDDCDGLFVPAPVGVGDSRAEKDLIPLLLLLRVDYLGTLQPRRQEADAPIDLAQAAFAIDVVAILRPIAVPGRLLKNDSYSKPIVAALNGDCIGGGAGAGGGGVFSPATTVAKR
jgi:hypothetical protein